MARQFSLRFHSVLAWPLFLFLLWVPFPLGSNRPVLWLANAILVSLLVLFSLWFEPSGRRVWAAGSGRGLLIALLVVVALGVVPGLGLLLVDGLSWPATSLNTLSVSPIDSAYSALQIVTYAMVFWLGYRVCRNGKSRGAFALLVGVITFHALYGLVQLAFADYLTGLKTVIAYEGKATGGFVNRNSFATYLALGLTVNFSLLYEQALWLYRKQRQKISIAFALLMLASLALIFAALLATESRMGLMAGLLGSVTVIAVQTAARREWAFAGLIVTLVLVTVLVILWNFGEAVIERILTADLNFDMRLSVYAETIRIWSDRPILGFGAGTFETIFGARKLDPELSGYLWDRAHNSFLSVLIELGSLGFVIMMAIFVWLLFVVVRKLTQGATTLAAAGLGALVVVSSHSLLDFSMEISAVAITFFAIMGFCGAAPLSTTKVETS